MVTLICANVVGVEVLRMPFIIQQAPSYAQNNFYSSNNISWIPLHKTCYDLHTSWLWQVVISWWRQGANRVMTSSSLQPSQCKSWSWLVITLHRIHNKNLAKSSYASTDNTRLDIERWSSLFILVFTTNMPTCGKKGSHHAWCYHQAPSEHFLPFLCSQDKTAHLHAFKRNDFDPITIFPLSIPRQLLISLTLQHAVEYSDASTMPPSFCMR
jgi:hypothetical protein